MKRWWSVWKWDWDECSRYQFVMTIIRFLVFTLAINIFTFIAQEIYLNPTCWAWGRVAFYVLSKGGGGRLFSSDHENLQIQVKCQNRNIIANLTVIGKVTLWQVNPLCAITKSISSILSVSFPAGLYSYWPTVTTNKLQPWVDKQWAVPEITGTPPPTSIF